MGGAWGRARGAQWGRIDEARSAGQVPWGRVRLDRGPLGGEAESRGRGAEGGRRERMPAHSPTASSWQALCLRAPRKSPPPAPTAERASALLLQPPGVVWQWGTFNNCAVAGDDDDEDGDAEAVADKGSDSQAAGNDGDC